MICLHEELPLLIPLSIGVVIILLLLFNNYVQDVGNAIDFQKFQTMLVKEREFFSKVNKDDLSYYIDKAYLKDNGTIDVSIKLGVVKGIEVTDSSKTWLVGEKTNSSMSLPALIESDIGMVKVFV